ncbi:gamma-glutamyltransferase [Sulfuriflexus mobilis]|uniref:gamma-glutamyltransferase n=1 Tax=Sulfuriflexus mobilis TaxID=1811807 RepID=UPI000F835066|nr:gamma-glutamyltransferase [Sulfuriflexus mobilis]
MRIFSLSLFLFIALSNQPLWAEVQHAAGIATAHPAATQAGHETLVAGGNAFDAAVTVSAVLAVVEPYSSGIGGGGFWLLHRARDGFQVMIDGRETAPGRAHRDLYLDAQGQVRPGASVDGPLAAAIPGVPAALALLARDYGRLPLDQSLAAAIRIAREGFAVEAYYQRMAGFRLQALRASPEAARIFLLNNEVPPLGHVIKQPELAATLALLAAQGAPGFYTGRYAQQLVTGVRDAGGIWRLEDLARYQAVSRQPLRMTYRGATITSVAPPSSGGVAMATIFNQLSLKEAAVHSEADQVHVLAEAMRRAYRDRAEYLGDADIISVPVSRLVGMVHAKQISANLDMDTATPSSELPGVVVDAGKGTDTTHFSILDSEGNRVAATLSVNYPFGSGFVVPGTGVLLNDEMDDFSAKPGVPNVYGLVGAEANAIAPYKRPLSSMSPTFVEDTRGLAIIGTPGGSRIITMVLHGIMAYINGGDAEAIVSKRRYHHQYLPDHIQYERGAFDEALASELQLRGHALSERDDFGNMQVVTWQRAGNQVSAASDPRGIGSAQVR